VRIFGINKHLLGLRRLTLLHRTPLRALLFGVFWARLFGCAFGLKHFSKSVAFIGPLTVPHLFTNALAGAFIWVCLLPVCAAVLSLIVGLF